ncbi:MAG: hypothetical protein OXT09_23250 [Myxococcales bacterium]|nr:hypothetical protein [Myxococcales bacterium]
MKRLFALAIALCLVGCASGPRFRDQPIVWRVHDDRPIPRPEKSEYLKVSYFADIFALRRLTRTLELRDLETAHDINALGEVPDSSWFTNRIGVRDLTPQQAARGPVREGPPVAPFTITRGKGGSGGNPGFFISDATDRTFLVKFDTRDNPEMQTAASVIVNRVLWTGGYHVPEDTLFTFSADQLRLAPDALTEDRLGTDIPLTWGLVREVLATSPRTVGGAYRASASLFLEGTPVGGFTPEGVRADDPNDRIPHEHRRSLRGLRVFAAWLGHTDMKMDNTLDMYVEHDGGGHLIHYLLDFGEALGSHQAEKRRLEDGFEHLWDWEDNTRAALALGLWKRTWEDQRQTPWPAIGAFGAEHFDPRQWKEAYPYWPFAEMDPLDAFWAAKLVMRFSPPMLEAIVAEGQLSNPDAARYLVDALIERRDRIGRAYLEALSPLDGFRIRDGELCMVDLAMHHGLAAKGIVERSDRSGEVWQSVTLSARGRGCLTVAQERGYRVARLRVRRGAELRPAVDVHFRAGPEARVLGVVRAH